MSKNYKVTGIVSYSGKTTNDEKNTILLKLDDEKIARIKELIGDAEQYDGIPLKETEDGEILFKLSSKFDVDIYDDGELIEDDEITLSNIGKGSKVTVFFSIGDSTYKRRIFCVAYLKSVNILELIESSKFNPYDKSADVEEL